MNATSPTIPSRDLGSIALVSTQLALTLLVIHQFQLESRTFFHVMLLAAAGFVPHALLPLQYRLGWFTLLSFAAIMIALGPVDGMFLVLLGLVLIGICHLQVRTTIRVFILLATGMLFAIWRMEWLPAPWSVAIWPILGSMFMFRLALYMYTLEHDRRRPTLAQKFSYFFMLPNVCFPLFPIIDYSTFIRTYYDRDAGRIYVTGIRWIVRGLIHLLLYRLVYLHLLNDPAQVLTLGDLVQFMVATFLLYLRVSGQFHLIAGVLHLFGFRLPETHHLYYLASSFTDFWRRINIYWKDFMMKLVFYPSYFRLRRRTSNLSLAVCTATVFLASWILHSYQWFWLRGGFPLELQDALFWSILGALVVFGSVREMNRPHRRTLSQVQVWSASLALSRLGTFTAICVIWSLWSADSVASWLTMLTAAENVEFPDLWHVAALVCGGLLVAGREWWVTETPDGTSAQYWRPAVHSAVLLLGMLVIGNPSFYSWYVPQFATIVTSLQRPTLNAGDAALQHKGYYEKLDNISRMSAQLWDIQARKPERWVGLSATEAYRVRNDFLGAELRPGVHIIFEDQPLTTNRWGMRDRDRVLAKPPGTYRIALLGPSHVMGSGVADGETFSDFLEERLNREARSATSTRYEVLNFGVAGYSLLQQFAILQERAAMFQPDVVIVTDSDGLKEPVVAHLRNVIQAGISIPYSDLSALVQRMDVNALGNPGFPVPFENIRSLLGILGIHTRMPGREADRRLRPAANVLVRWTLRRIASVTREHGAVPVFLALNVVRDPSANEMLAVKDAESAGLIVFNLLHLWQDRDKSALRIAEWDEHPNAAGNRLIADRLFELMYQHQTELRIGSR